MILNKHDILEDIKLKIDSIKLMLKKKPNNKRLKSQLSLQEEAYDFNEWLSWRALDYSPHIKVKHIKRVQRGVKYDLKNPVKLNELDNLISSGEYNGEEYQDIIDDFGDMKDDDSFN